MAGITWISNAFSLRQEKFILIKTNGFFLIIFSHTHTCAHTHAHTDTHLCSELIKKELWLNNPLFLTTEPVMEVQICRKLFGNAP